MDLSAAISSEKKLILRWSIVENIFRSFYFLKEKQTVPFQLKKIDFPLSSNRLLNEKYMCTEYAGNKIMKLMFVSVGCKIPKDILVLY